MDSATLESWSGVGTPGTNRDLHAPENLTDVERLAYDRCRAENLRVEQERITQPAVIETLKKAGLKLPPPIVEGMLG